MLLRGCHALYNHGGDTYSDGNSDGDYNVRGEEEDQARSRGDGHPGLWKDVISESVMHFSAKVAQYRHKMRTLE
jgi:hypothetical protein